MNPPSEDIKDFLIDGAVGTFGIDIFISKEPTTPHACVTVFDTGGENPDAHLVYDKPTVQVRVRGAKGSYEAAFVTAQAVRAALHGQANVVKNGTTYIGVWAVGDIMFIGYDDNDRPLLTINFRIHRTG